MSSPFYCEVIQCKLLSHMESAVAPPLALKVYGREGSGTGVKSTFTQTSASYVLSAHEFQTASGSPTGTINFSTRSAFYFTALRCPNVRATEDTDSTTWQPYTTISTLFGTYASGTTAEVMHTFLHRAFFQVKSPRTNHAEFWVQLLPSNQLSVYYQDSLKRLVALPASTAEAYSLQDYTLPAFCGDPTVKEVQQRLEEEWAAGAAAREAEAASRPRLAVGAEEEARTKQELAASLKELAALEKAIAEQSEELQRLFVERTRLSRGVTDLLGRVRGSTTLQLLSDVRGSTLE